MIKIKRQSATPADTVANGKGKLQITGLLTGDSPTKAHAGIGSSPSKLE
jgi:hypothetical protein